MITRERLVEEFALLDEKATLLASLGVIPKEIGLYLIGGGNLALRGIKDATADIDVVVENLRVLRSLDEVLTNPLPEPKVGPGVRVIYVKKVEHEYNVKLGAVSVYRKLDPELHDFNMDVFVKRVLKGLALSEGMKRRSVPPPEFKEFKTLKIRLVSLEDIFLFKGVTSMGRAKDIGDMIHLLEHGIDFGIILDELEEQKRIIEPEKFEWLVRILYEKSLTLSRILAERDLRTRALDGFIKELKAHFV